MLEVTVYRPDGTEEKHRFDKSSVMVGRAAGNDICVEVDGVSRYHTRFSLDGDSLIVQDLNSTNGTFVNAERITSIAIGPSDRISIGALVFTVVTSAGAEVASEVIESSTMFDLPVQSEVAAAAKSAAAKSAAAAAPASPDVFAQSGPNTFAQVTPAAFAQPSPAPAPSSVARPSAALDSAASAGAVQPPPAAQSHAPAEAHAEEHASKTDEASGDEKKASAAESFYWQSLKSFLAPVWDYITDDGVSEIMINGPREIYIERKGKLESIPARFTNDQLAAAALNIAQYVGRRVSEEEPYLDARLPDGSRVAVLVPPCSRKGISLAIRKFSKEKLTIERLLDFGSMSAEMVTYLNAAVMLKKNIIISGGTSSGKTSLLNVVSGLIPDDERIITIEDSAELQLRQDHVLPMETKPPDKKGRGQVTIRDLVKASLRMRPDRIVVGEIRSGEALDLLQAMNTGHSGSMATVHASSPSQALTRLETLALFSGLEIPMRALREQVASAIEVIIQASRLPDHSRKVTHISEVNKLSESGEYRVTDIFRYVREGAGSDGKISGRHRWTGGKSAMLEEMELAGLKDALLLFAREPEPLPAGATYASGGH